MNDALHVTVAGEGVPVVMLHGWGMHGGVFTPLANHLSANYRVLSVDLPGHGQSREYDCFSDIASLAEFIIRHIQRIDRQEFILLGWSMGGLLAQYLAASYPQQVRRLVLVAATPCFQAHTDWPHGIEKSLLTRFADELLSDYATTLSRFLALQFFGADDQRENLRRVRELVFARPAPQTASLRAGLELLERTDLRAQLGSITCPVLLLNGERDTLVPATALRYMAEHLRDARGVLFKGAGHAPFLSHAGMFNERLLEFLADD